MKFLKITFAMFLFAALLTSCSSVKVASDYDQSVDFNKYKTYAFFKPGIDKAEVSDLDKKRILRGIESAMSAQGYIKSEDPDMLVSIFTKTNENINIYQNNMMGFYGYGWGGWNPYYWGAGRNTISSTSEGTLYIDLIDAKDKELIWQGMGTAALATDASKKQNRVNEIVAEILKKFPPGKE